MSSTPAYRHLRRWPDLPGELPIRASVGKGAFERGREYARAGRVRIQTSDPAQRMLHAKVLGSGRQAYETFVRVGDKQGNKLSSGHCTCPVRFNCKHVAAVLLAACAELDANVPQKPGAPEWERLLSPLKAPPEGGFEGVPMGLQFEPLQTHARGGAPGSMIVRMRPVLPGKKAPWVRGGVDWDSLAYRNPDAVDAHREALMMIYSAFKPGRYSYGRSEVHLHEFGPRVWTLLREVAAAGVALVDARREAQAVSLWPAPASYGFDFSAAPDGSLAGKVTIDFPGLPGVEAVHLADLGEPPHGLVLDYRVPDGHDAGATGLILAPLGRPLTRQASDILDAGAIAVPAQDTDRFLTEYYPILSRTLTVTSRDGSVELPQIQPPALGLRLTYTSAHELGLEWSFRYEVGGAVRHHPLTRAGDSTRDRVTEQTLLDELEIPGWLWAATQPSGPRPVAQLRGVDVAVFTDQVLPHLRDQGVVVEVEGTPGEYRHTEAAPTIRLSATDAGGGDGSGDGGGSGQSDWFDLGVAIDIDGEDVPFERLFVALSREDSHLVLDSGTYFSLERPELEQLRALIAEARVLQDKHSDSEGLRISAFQAGLWEELAALGVVEVQSERWQSQVRTLLAGEMADPPPVPEGIRAELRAYQEEGFRWLSYLWDAGLGGILADDMGLGKTLQVLATILRAKEAATLEAPALVVAPTSVVANWADEAERFAPDLKVVTVSETERRAKRPLAQDIAGADVVVTSYAIFRIDEDAYRGLPWSALVLDEAQFVKNHQAKTYQVARRLPARFKLAITGTPLENSLMDLWSLLSIVAPGMFADPKIFTEMYRKPIEAGTNPELLAQLRRRIRPFIRRRTKEQVATDLPEKVEQVLRVQLNAKHRKVYDTHLQRERHKVLSLLDDVDKNRFTILRSLTLLRQLSLDAGLVDEQYAEISSSKVDVFLEHLDEVIGGGHRALVFSQFTGFLAVVRARLDAAGIRYQYLDGRTRKRAQVVDEFRSGDAPVFLISLKAGGFGLNLTEADYCFVLDPWWNPAAEAQAVDRTHRIGQHKNVMVYRMVAEDTIEEKVLALQERKRDLFARVIDEGGELSTPLSASDIKDLLAV